MITRRNLNLLAWTLVMAGLYFLFGRFIGGVVEETSLRLAGSLRDHPALTADLSTAAVGPLFLGLSRIYQSTAHRENAGSMAAWLAGWGLLLFYGSQAVARYSSSLAVVLLLSVLALRLARPLARRLNARHRR